MKTGQGQAQAVRYLDGRRHVLHVHLEPVFADAFVREAERRGTTRAALMLRIEQAKPATQGLNSAVRCWLLEQAIAREAK